MDKIFAFIGFGLIGGSMAKAIKKHLPDSRIYAYMRSSLKLEQAKSDKIVDLILEEVDETLADCDMIFLCAPVEWNEYYAARLRPYIKADCILSDVGSTKTAIHRCITELGLEENFIGGHPMAGSEKTGYENATPLLLENAYYMLTPTKKVSRNKIQRLLQLVQSIKAIPFPVDYERHDDIVAAVSHLPHLVAASLVNLIKQEDAEDGLMRRVAAGGFKDITRIASSSPIIWEQICESNKEPILYFLDKYIRSLEDIREALAETRSGAIHSLFESSKNYRNTFPDEQIGLLSAHSVLSVQVEDKPGAISIVSAILAASGISIRNIGLNHNREYGEGVLKIAFYDADACELAAKQLELYNYKVERH